MKKNRLSILNVFKERYVAHRGLFDNASEAPENTMPAFKKAVEAGYGIELDVQLSKDNKVVVTHDYSLKRICGMDKLVIDLTYNELSKHKILNSQETIPLLSDVLDSVNGKVPIIVELKAERDYEEICRLTNDVLLNYNGIYCVESFSPFVVNWFRKKSPDVIRGQLADDFLHKGRFKSTVKNWLLTNMAFNFITRPDFVAYNHEFGKKRCIGFWKKVLGCYLVAYTVKSQDGLNKAAEKFDIIIFDSFTPQNLRAGQARPL